jgi:hypothetical protein
MMGGFPICSGVCMLVECDFDNLRPHVKPLDWKVGQTTLLYKSCMVLVFLPIPTMVLTKYRYNYIKLHKLMWNIVQKRQLRKDWVFALYQVCSRLILDCWLLNILLYRRKGLLFSMFSISQKIVHWGSCYDWSDALRTIGHLLGFSVGRFFPFIGKSPIFT